jgi:hypothetical protein
MRILLAIIVVMSYVSVACASTPSTQPATSDSRSRKRPVPLSMQEATEAMGLLGPVKTSRYSVTYAPPRSDPFQVYRDRYNYGTPSYSPYLFGCYGWPCYGWAGGYGSYGCGGGWMPGGASIFYGD